MKALSFLLSMTVVFSVKDPQHLQQFKPWPELEVERFPDGYEDSNELIGCTYSYNEEKTPEMESFNAATAFNAIEVDLYRLLKPGYHLIHETSKTPARASAIGDFGLQTTNDCVPEVVMMKRSKREIIGSIQYDSDVFHTVLEGRVVVSGSWMWTLETNQDKTEIFLHLPEKEGCSYILEHASITFYRLKNDPEAFSSVNCPVGAKLSLADQIMDTIFSQPNPDAIFQGLEQAPVVQTFYDLRRYNIAQQIKVARNSIASALQRRLAKFTTFQVYVMTFLDAEAEAEQDRQKSTAMVMDRACKHLSNIAGKSIDCTKTSFTAFCELFETNIIGVSTLPPVPTFPRAKEAYDVLSKALNFKRRLVVLSVLDRDPDSVRIVDAFFYFASYSFAHVFKHLDAEIQKEYYDRMQDWTIVTSFIGMFLNEPFVYPPNHDKIKQATQIAATGACAYLPGSLDASTVSMGELLKQMMAFMQPWILLTVPKYEFAKRMYKRFEVFIFGTYFKEHGPRFSLDTGVVEIFYTTIQHRLARRLGNNELKRITRFLMIFSDTTVEGNGIKERAVIQLALHTTEKACAFLQSIGGPAMDYRTVTGTVFLQQIDQFVTQETLKTIEATTERAQSAYDHFEATLGAKRRKINA